MPRTLHLLLLLALTTACNAVAAEAPASTAVARLASPTDAPLAATAATEPLPTDQAPQATAPPVTDTAVPTDTPPPPPTPTPRPTSTPRATATNTPGPTNTPRPTLTPSPTPVVPCFSEPAPASRGRFRVAPGPWPRPPATPGEIYFGNGRTDLSLLHLGFDVEGDSTRFGAMLDVLDKHGVKATMFITGLWAEQNPGWVRAIIARGHEIANHTYSHPNIANLDAETLRQELNRTEDILWSLTGQSTKPWFRPPFGSRSAESLETVYGAGWTTVIWTAGSEDWQADTTYQTMCDNLGLKSFPGAILYTHTNHPDTAVAMDHFIYQMHLRGYSFVPLSVMMAPDPAAYLINN